MLRSFFHFFIAWFDYLIFVYFIILNSFYILLIFLSLPEIIRRFKETTRERFHRLLNSDTVPPISIIAPAYNEEKNIIQSIESFINLSYPHLRIIIVNDGSNDNTLEKLKDYYQLYRVPMVFQNKIAAKPYKNLYKSKKEPFLTVVDKENGGKADALNAGINVSKTPFFIVVDSDTIIERDSLQRMIRPVLTKKNVIASGATIRLANNCEIKYGNVRKIKYPKKLLPSIQVVEYLRAFLFGRLGWNHLGGNLVISGAFGLFKKSAVVEIGGYKTDTVGEDIEIIVRLHKYFREKKEPYKILFIPDPVAWTEVPSDWKSLGSQRERWHRGLIETLTEHREMLLNPKYGIVGLISYPFLFFGEMLAPIIELLGYIGLAVGLFFNIVNIEFAIFFFIAAWGLMMILTIFTLHMEIVTFNKYEKFSDFLKMIFYAIVENIGYRQISVWWRLKAFWKFFRTDKNWGEIKRIGFEEEKDE